MPRQKLDAPKRVPPEGHASACPVSSSLGSNLTIQMESLEEIKTRAEQAVAGAVIEIIANPGPANQPSLLLHHAHAVAVARFLRDDPALRLDFCSNVTGVDWL